VSPTPADWPVGEAPPWPGAQAPYGRHELFVRHAEGSTAAEPAVMIHGLGGQATNWTDLMGLLSDRVDSWAPDLPGFGWSPPAVGSDYSLEALAGSVEAFTETLHTPVHLFGNSLGGAIAVRLAANRPDLVRSLVLTSPALPDLRPRRHTVGVPIVAVPGLGEQMWRRLATIPPERQVQAMLEMNFGDPSVVTSTRRQEAIAEYRRRYQLPYAGEALSKTARGLLRAFVDGSPTGLWRQAASLHCPSLVIYGGRDRLVNPRRARKAARTVPGARIVMLPKVGHVAQMEAPVTVAHFTRSFLDGVSGG
jgi:pimeloyl-ACP methyl ester carboxylesterase